VIYLPLYHPAAALHQPALRRLIEEDFKKIPALLASIPAVPEQPEKPATPPQQLNLF
jgi:DNA polymerase